MWCFQNLRLINLRHLLTIVEELIRVIVNSRSILRPPRSSKFPDRSLSPAIRPPSWCSTNLLSRPFLSRRAGYHILPPPLNRIRPRILSCAIAYRYDILNSSPYIFTLSTTVPWVSSSRSPQLSSYLFTGMITESSSCLYSAGTLIRYNTILSSRLIPYSYLVTSSTWFLVMIKSSISIMSFR